MGNIIRSVSPNAGFVGDVFTYKVVVDHKPGEVVNLVPSSGVWGDFELRHVARTVVTDKAGVHTTFEAQVSVYELGDRVIPTQTVKVLSQEVTIPALPVTIKSVLTSESPTPNGLKPPMSLSLSWGLYLGVLIVLVLALLSGFFAYRFLKKRFQRVVETVAPVDTKTAYEKALDALTALEKEDLAASGDFKTHYLRLSDLLKTLFSHHYGAAITEMTTDETLRFLSRKIVLDRIHRVREILEVGDLVKFAKSVPDLSVHYDVLVKARDVVEWFRPEIKQ